MSALTGTVVLVRLALRRDRLRLPMWLGGLAALLALVAAANAETYATDVDRTAAATLLAGSPALRLMRGAAAGPSLGAIMSDGFWLLSVSAALMSGLGVIRHTRQNEETGRGEGTGRHQSARAPTSPRRCWSRWPPTSPLLDCSPWR